MHAIVPALHILALIAFCIAAAVSDTRAMQAVSIGLALVTVTLLIR